MAADGGLLAAIRAGNAEAVRAELAADPALSRYRDEHGVSAICLAVYLGREPIARLIADTRDDLDVFEAAALGDARRIRELLAATPSLVSSYSPDGFHPLGLACFFGRPDAADLLLRAGADVEAPARNPMQVRPLHSAVAHSDPDVALVLARRLLLAGASPNAAQQGGFTPLHEAAYRGNEKLVRELLRHGASATALSAEGASPAQLALQGGHRDVAALLAPTD
jgi:ankyrin repeat protein